LKHRLQNASSGRITRSIAARAIALNGAEIRLRVTKDVLASGLEQNIGVIKKFIKDTRAKHWSSDTVDAVDVIHHRWLLVPAIRFVIDVLAHPEPATHAVRCIRSNVRSTNHSTGPTLDKLDKHNVIILQSANNIWLSRIHPNFAALMIVQPTLPAEPEPADKSDRKSTSNTGSLSGSESGSSSDSENLVDSNEETEDTEDPPAVPAGDAGADDA
jgi:hypothetical protein